MTANSNKLHASKWIKRVASAAALWLLAGVAIAQGGATDDKYGCRNHAPGTMATEKGASCMPVGRSGDPFVFCTEGVPTDCWMAINPLTGQWQQICKYLNRRWINTYEQICPRAMSMGHWQGQGAPSMTPFVH